MSKRVCVIVLDSVGIGELPDAAEFGDAGANTLGNIFGSRGRLLLPNLYAMGLGNIENSGLPGVPAPTAAFGRLSQKTKAKDTTSGHWELAGLIMDTPFRTFPQGFPEDLLNEWVRRAGLTGYLGNKPASGTAIIDELGEDHMKTQKPIVYTSADSVFQVAAHEKVIPIEEQYRICAEARALLVDEYCVGRVIARPFVGTPGNFERTKNRKDYAVEPPEDTILDVLAAKGKKILGIGKIEDIFCNRGITHVNHTTNNKDGIDATIDALRTASSVASNSDSSVAKNAAPSAASGPAGSTESLDLIFTNLVDFDMLYGHRNDVEGYAAALEYFDTRLPEIVEALGPDDILFITADHGCDPTTAHTDHSREYVPMLIYGEKVQPVDLGTGETFADLGATVFNILCGEVWHVGRAVSLSSKPWGSAPHPANF